MNKKEDINTRLNELIDESKLNTTHEAMLMELKKPLNEAKESDLKKLKDPTKFNKFFRKIGQRVKKNSNPKTILIINMELQNGNFDTFYVEYNFDSFSYNKGRYILDNDSKYYHVGYKAWVYDFREGISLPFKRLPFPVNDVKKAFEQNEEIDYEYSLNAKNLEQFSISKVIEAVLSGQALGEQFKMVLIMVIISLFLGGINVVMGMQMYSMIKALGMP